MTERQRGERPETPLHVKIDHLLTEARVILPGAQALLGFQLSIVLTQAFERLPQSSRIAHAVSIGLVIGGFYLFNAGSISMGAIIAVVMLAGRSMSPVGQLAFLMTRARQAMLIMESLQRLTEAPDERSLSSRSVIPTIGRGDIKLEHASFRYPEASRDSLTDVTLKIVPSTKASSRYGLPGG